MNMPSEAQGSTSAPGSEVSAQLVRDVRITLVLAAITSPFALFYLESFGPRSPTQWPPSPFGVYTFIYLGLLLWQGTPYALMIPLFQGKPPKAAHSIAFGLGVGSMISTLFTCYPLIVAPFAIHILVWDTVKGNMVGVSEYLAAMLGFTPVAVNLILCLFTGRAYFEQTGRIAHGDLAAFMAIVHFVCHAGLAAFMAIVYIVCYLGSVMYFFPL